MFSINTNLSSLIAQRSLNNSTQLLNQAIERMTTGYKINHAKDNAANYAIATNMTTKIGAYQVAEDNTAMGLDMVTTASDSLNIISDKLARLRALAEQAANGTYGKQSLNAIDTEARAIIDEMFRTKNNTEYNGKKLFGESVGPDMSKLAVNADGFIQDVQKRDTASMTSLKSVNESSVLTKGTYSISSAEELAKLARMQNAGRITAGSEFVLAADIDLSGYSNWTPIGWENGNLQTSKAFSGTFDGNGYKIKNLTSNQNGTSAAGLFGSVNNSILKNAGIENVKIKGTFAGSLVGNIQDNKNVTLENCYADYVNISANQYVGGSRIGGLVGGVNDDTAEANANTSANITSCYTTHAIIDNLWWDRGGGIIGSVHNATIKNSFSEVNISGIDSIIGGLSGLVYNNIDFDNCYVKGNCRKYASAGGQTGGISGGGDGTIKNCYFEGSVIGDSGCVGGILPNCHGANPVYIENCSVKADIKSPSTCVGAIAGCMDCEGGYVKNCHFDGTITGNAIVAEGVEGKLEVKDCTYNKSLCGELKGIGNDLGTSSNITDMILNTSLQVGIYGDNNSQIDFNTFLQLDELRSLYISGLNQENAFEIIDNLSLKISSIQTQLGSVENRLESVLEEISTHYENLSSSRSTLKDADIADVSSQYIKQQILQQASVTLLATANQAPSIALQLL